MGHCCILRRAPAPVVASSVLLIVIQVCQALSLKAAYVALKRCTVFTETAVMIDSMLRRYGSWWRGTCDACFSAPAAAPALSVEN